MFSQNRKGHFRRRVDELIHHAADRLSYGRASFFRLMRTVWAKTALLVPCSQSGHDRLEDAAHIVHACANMANYRCHWQRCPEEWIPPDANPTPQFQSLVSHLFDRYPVPRFMAWIWVDADATDPQSRWLIRLYLHLAKGHSIRAFPLPLPFGLTKAAAAQFMQAPDDFNPYQALRWSWIRSLGAETQLARQLTLHPCLDRPVEVQHDWSDTVRFLIRNQPIGAEEVNAIVQFVDQQRYQPAEVVWGPGAGSAPLQADLTLQGRTLMSLRRHMVNWREDLLRKNDSIPSIWCTRWPATPIQPLRYQDGDRVWSIEELRTAKELQIEGSILRHCAANYAAICAARKTTIWSMKVEHAGVRRRVLTIEVRPDTKAILQSGGKRNARPTHRVAEMLQRWADQEGLILPEARVQE